MLGSNPGLLRLWHWRQLDALTTRLNLKNYPLKIYRHFTVLCCPLPIHLVPNICSKYKLYNSTVEFLSGCPEFESRHPDGGFIFWDDGNEYRVYRVHELPAGRLNWLPFPLKRVCPPRIHWGDTHSLGGEGGGGANSDEGTDAIMILCILIPSLWKWGKHKVNSMNEFVNLWQINKKRWNCATKTLILQVFYGTVGGGGSWRSVQLNTKSVTRFR